MKVARPHRAYLGLLIVPGLVPAGPDLFRVWASLSPKAASVHRKAKPYGAGCVGAQKKRTQYRFPWNLAGSEDLSPWCGNGNWEEGAVEEKVFQSFCITH